MIRVQRESFDAGAELNAMLAKAKDPGAAVAFVGLVREMGETGRIRAISLEHYPGMTERELARIEAEAAARFRLDDALVIHRYGEMKPGDPIVLVITMAKHRQDAFAAAQFLMDYLKTRAPFWKAETGDSGVAWVEARASDDESAKRWKK